MKKAFFHAVLLLFALFLCSALTVCAFSLQCYHCLHFFLAVLSLFVLFYAMLLLFVLFYAVLSLFALFSCSALTVCAFFLQCSHCLPFFHAVLLRFALFFMQSSWVPRRCSLALKTIAATRCGSPPPPTPTRHRCLAALSAFRLASPTPTRWALNFQLESFRGLVIMAGRTMGAYLQ